MRGTSKTQGEESGGGRVYSAPALEKGFDIIELLATANEGLTISEMAARLGRSISEIFRMIIVMERRRWLYKDPETDRYRVTYRLLDIAFRATPGQQLAKAAAPVMARLAREVEQSCHLVVRHDQSAFVIAREESPGVQSFAVRLGTVVNLIASSSGHVLLAFAEDEVRANLLANASYPAGMTAEDVGSIIKRVRKRGYETMASARVAGVWDISYPIFGFDGRVAAALTIPFVTLIDGSQVVDFEAARESLAEATREISHALGLPEAELAQEAG